MERHLRRRRKKISRSSSQSNKYIYVGYIIFLVPNEPVQRRGALIVKNKSLCTILISYTLVTLIIMNRL